jgi:hypothetical protein
LSQGPKNWKRAKKSVWSAQNFEGKYPNILLADVSALHQTGNTTQKNGVLMELHTKAVRDNPMPEREQGQARVQPQSGPATCTELHHDLCGDGKLHQV